ncbi:MAG: DDE-type integrase/transposase/recombinase [Methyloceanibacter sp.]
MKVIGNAADQECGRWLNNRAENSHQPFRRRERAMQRYRAVRTLQKFAAAHASRGYLRQRPRLRRRPWCACGTQLRGRP